MFTGIIKGIGEISDLRRLGGSMEIAVRWAGFREADLSSGDSVSIDGACLSAERVEGDVVWFLAVEETLKRTTLGMRKAGDKVNIELPLKASDYLGGHMVTGHVDCVGKIVSFRQQGIQRLLRVEYPAQFNKFVVEKGSVAVDGISLTITRAGENFFECAIIRETLTKTTLGKKNVGDAVNVEFDILAKYVEKLLSKRHPSGASEDDIVALY